MTLALGRHAHLRALVSAPLTLRDLPIALPQALAQLTGRPAPPLPGPTPGDGQTAPTPPPRPSVLGTEPWWQVLGIANPAEEGRHADAAG